MAKHISQAQWAKYQKVINEFHEDANQDTVLWYRLRPHISRQGEDESLYLNPIPLKFLAYFNYFRTWPLTEYTGTGEIDRHSLMALFNVSYLDGLGYTDSEKKFIAKEDTDIFVHRNSLYKSSGGTFMSQAHGTPLLYCLIFKRETNIQYKDLPPWQENELAR